MERVRWQNSKRDRLSLAGNGPRRVPPNSAQLPLPSGASPFHDVSFNLPAELSTQNIFVFSPVCFRSFMRVFFKPGPKRR